MEWIEADRETPEIGPGEVHVWRFPLNGQTGADTASVLSREEQSRADGMTSPKARVSFVTSQSALREILARYTGADPLELTFVRGPHGKPVLAGGDGAIEFNVSHSGDWGLIAVARVAVGVDVEQVRPRSTTPHLEQRFLTPGERNLLAQRAGEHGESAFFMVWSRKEAYLKAAGLGLAAPFSRVDSSGERLPDLGDDGVPRAGEAPWSVREFFVDDRHPAAVVVRAPTLSATFLTFRSPHS